MNKRDSQSRSESRRRENFERETRIGNGSPWNGLHKDTKPARNEIDKGEWSPKLIKDF